MDFSEFGLNDRILVARGLNPFLPGSASRAILTTLLLKSGNNGGADENRTHDLVIENVKLSQLSISIIV